MVKAASICKALAVTLRAATCQSSAFRFARSLLLSWRRARIARGSQQPDLSKMGLGYIIYAVIRNHGAIRWGKIIEDVRGLLVMPWIDRTQWRSLAASTSA